MGDSSSKRSSPWWWLSDESPASSLPSTVSWPKRQTPDPQTLAGLWKPGDLIADLYEVREVFTSGGRGLVYRVHHRGWHMDLAVKCPRTEFFQSEQDKADFEHEAETWVKLGLHPHLATCHYVRRLDAIPRVFAEYVSGGSLAEWIRSRKLYSGGPTRALERILDIAIQFAWGLQHAHEQGLVHRDVKPGNVLMTSDGIAKVTDFGMAKAKSLGSRSGSEVESAFANASVPDPNGSILVSAGGLTPAFCSPEQIQGRSVSRKTDIWSWGVSLLHMFIGSTYWSAGYLAAGILADYLGKASGDDSRPQAPRGNIPAMPPLLGDLLRQCFQSNPDDRPRDMMEIVAVLQRLYAQTFGKGYRRPAPQAAKARAGALNNRALSLRDLNKHDEAQQLWQEALTISPQHPESTYNLGLTRWRLGSLTTESLQQQLHDVGLAHPGEWLPPYLLARMQLEEGDWHSALEALERVPASGAELDEVRDVRTSAQSCLNDCGRLVRRFSGHSGWVSSVCAGRNGRAVLSGSADGTLKLWSAMSGRCLRTLEGHSAWVTSVGLSGDGRIALSGSADRTLRLWQMDNGQCLGVLEGHRNWVLAAALSDDGRLALSGGGDGTIKLWETATGVCLRNLDGHEGPVLAVCYSSDGRQVLSASRDRTLLLWDVESGQRLRTFSGHADKVLSAVLSGDGRFVLSGSGDRTIRLWDAAAGRCLRVYEGHQGSVTSVCFSAGGGYLLSGSEDRTIKIWQRHTGRCLATLEGHTGTVHSLCLLSRSASDGSGRQMLSASADATLALWTVPSEQSAPYVLSRVLPSDIALSAWTDYERSLKLARQAVEAGESVRAAQYLREARSQSGHGRRPEAMAQWSSLYVRLPRLTLQGAWGGAILDEHTEAVTSVALSNDGRLALSGSADRTLRLWQPAEGLCLHTLEGDMGGVTATALSGDGCLALSGSTDATLRLWDVRTGDCLRNCREDLDVLTSVALSSDGRLAVSAGVDGTVHLWDVSAGRLLRVLRGHTGPVHSVALSGDGRFALSGSALFVVRNDGERMFTNGQLKLWETATGRCLPLFENQPDAVTAVALSADGRFALAGCGQAVIQRDSGRFVQSGMVHLWELATSRRMCTFEGHRGAVTSVCLSFDGRYALSGSTDATVKLWEVASGQCLRTFAGHGDAVTSVALSADGRFALSGSADHTLRLWVLDWELADTAPADWDEGARPYLEMFLSLHTPYTEQPQRKRGLAPLTRWFKHTPAEKENPPSLTRQGAPAWTEADFQELLRTLGYAGYGWLRPAGVRWQLRRMTRHWQGAAPLKPLTK